jgi:hypothetical protein
MTLLCASSYGMYVVESTDGTDAYEVKFYNGDKVPYCLCKGWKFKKGAKTCRHVERVRVGACFARNAAPTIRPVGYTTEEFTGAPCAWCGGPTVEVR